MSRAVLLAVALAAWPATAGAATVGTPMSIVTDEPGRAGVVLTAGHIHSCAIAGNGTVTCWGSPQFGALAAPAGEFLAINTDESFSCGVRVDGTVACWGLNNTLGNLTPPAGTFTSVGLGRTHACGIRTDGTIACWGENQIGQGTPPAGTFIAVDGGINFTCGLRTDGTLACWGASTIGDILTPPAGEFTSLSAYRFHACAVRADGTVACWGINILGSNTPPAGTFLSVGAGQAHTCGIRTDGTLACWGDNSLGQLTAPAGTFTSLAVGDAHACAARSDGTVACWGNLPLCCGAVLPPAGSLLGQIVSAGSLSNSCLLDTDGTLECIGSDDLGQVSGVPAGAFRQLDAGHFQMCAVEPDGDAVCWGGTAGAQEGVAPAGTFRAVAAGALVSCGVLAAGTLDCWGDDSVGQATPPAGTFRRAAVNNFIGCGLRSSGALACWGSSATGATTPPAGVFTALGVGSDHGCALATDGTLACWGRNVEGQASPPAGTFTAVSAGLFHTCAIRTGGTLACWGWNDAGQSTPPAGTFRAVSAGQLHTCGTRTNGVVTCWGDPTALINPADTTPPDTSITDGPPDPATTGDASFTFESTEVGSTFECALDAGPFEPCASPKAYAGLAPGAHTFRVRAVDAGQNADPTPAQRAWTVSDDATPPSVVGMLTGTLGADGWFTSDVGVDWDVSDPDSDITETTGCDASAVTADTAGTDLTCSATSAGGTTEETVTVKRDATPPTVTCGAAPKFSLRGPGGPVSAAVEDATSGPVADVVSAPASVATMGARTARLTGADQAGNETDVDCPYVVGPRIVSQAPTSPPPLVLAGRPARLRFLLTDAAGARITDAEGLALEGACAVQGVLQAPGGAAQCADYRPALDDFLVVVPVPAGTPSGTYEVVLRVRDGATVLRRITVAIRVVLL